MPVFGTDRIKIPDVVRIAPVAPGVLESSVSEVIAPAQVETLPFAGRDVYSALSVLPAVTSNSGVARSLGLSAAGQRPSSSNYLLDGFETNNYLIVGPLLTVPPEAVQEYRLSLTGFSPEYGRTAGYIANAVAGDAWHGILYTYVNNAVLNATDAENKRLKVPRSPVRALQTGYQVGGRLGHRPLYLSLSFDLLRSRDRDVPQAYTLVARQRHREGKRSNLFPRDRPAPGCGLPDPHYPSQRNNAALIPPPTRSVRRASGFLQTALSAVTRRSRSCSTLGPSAPGHSR